MTNHQPSSPKVSVILPAYEATTTIERAITSIRQQTFSDWELIVIDDGSADGTAQRVDAVAKIDPRIRVVRRGHDGLVAALNAGLAVARGPFVARMDADDVSHPGRLAQQATYLAGHPDIGVVGCLVEFGGERRASEGYALYVDWLNGLTTPEAIAMNRFVESPFAHPSVMFRRDLVAQHGGYRAGAFPEDYELWLRWLDAGVRMAKVPAVLLTWYDGPCRLSRIDARYAPERFFALKAEWIARSLHRRGPRVVLAGQKPGEASGLVAKQFAGAVWIWGAGRPTRKRASWLELHGVKIAGYIDVDAKKTTPAIGGTGAPVIPPAEVPPPGQIVVLGYVSSRGARELIRAELARRGYVEGRDFLMCA